MSRAWSGGSTRQWRKIREQVLDRDNYICQIQLPACTIKATTAHHTLGRAITGDNPEYIIAACARCNEKTGDPMKTATDPQPITPTQW